MSDVSEDIFQFTWRIIYTNYSNFTKLEIEAAIDYWNMIKHQEPIVFRKSSITVTL